MSGIIGKREVRGSGVVSRHPAPVLSVSGSTGVVADSDIDHDSLGNFAAGEHFTQANITTIGTVTTGTISTGAVIDDPTMTQGSDATGDVYYRAASGKLTRLATGADGTVLTSTGTGAVPAFEAAPSGAIVQIAYMEDGGVATGETLFPDDDTIPQITEGDEYMTLAITPTSATNKLMIDVVFNVIGGYSGANRAYGAIFNTDWHATNALVTGSAAVESSYMLRSCFARIVIVAGTLTIGGHSPTASTTFRFRAGSASIGITTFNGRASGRKVGGTLLSSMRITEIKV